MRVVITTAGHSVDIETTEDGMNAHRLANIAVNTWRRTRDPQMRTGWGVTGIFAERAGGATYHEPSDADLRHSATLG